MRTRPTRSQIGDGWYESEPSTRSGFVAELQRIRRRTVVRPIPALVLATLLTAAICYRVVTKQRLREAEIVLALTEGVLSGERMGLQADQLREYVTSVLMSDKNLSALIERRNLHPLRRHLGPQFALAELWDQLEVDVWKNSFLYYDLDDQNSRKSARIAITVIDTDPDHAYSLAIDIAHIVIATHDAERAKLSAALTQEVARVRDVLDRELSTLTTEIVFKQAALTRARLEQKHGLGAALFVDLTALDQRAKVAEEQLSLFAQSRDGIADQIAAAGLDVTLAIAEERRPERPEGSTFIIILVFVVVAAGALVASAIFVGAFDPRIHDTDDVERLGLPVLGHVPAFAGDHVGSMKARGIRRPRRTP